MKQIYPRLILSLLLTLFTVSTSMAQKSNVFWNSLDSKKINKTEIEFYKAIPKKSTFFTLDIDGLNNLLKDAPQRNSLSKTSNLVMYFPDANGKFESYTIMESSIMEPKLQAKFPNIKSYVGQGIDSPESIIRFSISPEKGLNGMILSSSKTVFIEPYTKDLKTYIVFINSDSDINKDNFVCETQDFVQTNNISEEAFSVLKNADDGQLRTYRLALACTGEYATFHGGTMASVMSAMNITMTRVNGVFERDLSLTMQMVDNTNLIFFNANSDPYTNSNGSAMLSQNQTTCDNIIGTNNYDIGHVFSTGGGGVAYLNSPCTNLKAGGVTGLDSPVGDTFDIDYVAHEMGHQYGGNHTQNNNCQRSSVSVEPGSASTIMGYAGICSPNVQNNSDDYFNGANIREMWLNISLGNSSSCPQLSATGNAAPIANAGADYSIPKSTAFVLKGAATDANTGDGLTYCWEQTDTTPAVMPPASTSTAGPAFRSLDPSTSTDRYMPAFSTVISGSLASTWEVVPSVQRTLNFSLTVRDNVANGASTTSDNMVVNVEDVTPFTVSTPSTWTPGTSQTVNWVVGQTNGAIINCQAVNILFSSNGGVTFDTTIASAVANTGSATITVPNAADTTDAMILVEADDNIFYAVSNTFSVDNTLSTEEFALNNLNIYPNPNTGEFTVQFSNLNQSDTSISVYDIRGRVVYNKSYVNTTEFNQNIELGNASSGMYILKINHGAKTVIKKVIVK